MKGRICSEIMAWSLQSNKEIEDHFKAGHSKHPVNKGPRGSKGFEFRDEDYVGSSSPLRDLGKLRVRRGMHLIPSLSTRENYTAYRHCWCSASHFKIEYNFVPSLEFTHQTERLKCNVNYTSVQHVAILQCRMSYKCKVLLFYRVVSIHV